MILKNRVSIPKHSASVLLCLCFLITFLLYIVLTSLDSAVFGNYGLYTACLIRQNIQQCAGSIKRVEKKIERAKALHYALKTSHYVQEKHARLWLNVARSNERVFPIC